MGRNVLQSSKVSPSGPITKPFGRGNVQFFYSTTTWTIPTGVTAVRVRVWGGGANYYYLAGSGKNPAATRAGAGGGFAMKVVTGLTPGGTVTVTVPAIVSTNGAAGGTCSFGAHVSATGGSASSSSSTGGAGSSGDVNYTGGATNSDNTIAGAGGGGVANLFGDGGDGSVSGSGTSNRATNKASGGGGQYGAAAPNSSGGSSFFARGGVQPNTAYCVLPESGNLTGSLDLIGVGGGGAGMVTAGVGPQKGINGGGGGGSTGSAPGSGGFPGGGCGSGSSVTPTNAAMGAAGLVIVEW